MHTRNDLSACKINSRSWVQQFFNMFWDRDTPPPPHTHTQAHTPQIPPPSHLLVCFIFLTQNLSLIMSARQIWNHHVHVMVCLSKKKYSQIQNRFCRQIQDLHAIIFLAGGGMKEFNLLPYFDIKPKIWNTFQKVEKLPYLGMKPGIWKHWNSCRYTPFLPQVVEIELILPNGQPIGKIALLWHDTLNLINIPEVSYTCGLFLPQRGRN